ncbi:MAG: NADH-quinone oxidoreductase subunit C [Rhodoferax sp.]
MLSFQELLAQTQQALEAKNVLMSWFGQPEPGAPLGGDTRVTAVLLGAQGLRVLQARVAAQTAYPALSTYYPGAQAFERELWEQTGLQPQSHPWLKPLRFAGANARTMADYPFFKVRGAEVHEVGVGPIHAGVIEPGHFRFMCHGEQVHHLEIQLGYQHRGVEALLLRKPPQHLTPLVESIAGDSVVAYAWAFNAALEALAGHDTAPAVQTSRAVALELERLAMHLATLTGLVTDVGYLQPAGTYQRLRTAIINATQRVCGNRFGKGWIRPGAAAPLTDAVRQDLQRTLAAFAPDFLQVNALVRSSRSAQARFCGVGVVSAATALDLNLWGPVGRASGRALDLRLALPSGAYARQAPQAITQSAGDCWARLLQRVDEAQDSLRWLQTVLANPALDLASSTAPFAPQPESALAAWPLAPNACCVAPIEGVRGPVLLALSTDAQGQLCHVKVQDPSLTNWFGLAWALRQQQISDFPICNKSFDLSYCGHDL